MSGHESKRVLVTGAAGFLGTNLCKRLLRDGHRVIGLDNLQTGSRSNLAELSGRFEFVRHDLTEPLPAELEADEIYNLACAASPQHYQLAPGHTVLTSVRGAWDLLAMAQRCQARIFQSSTSEVYGNPQIHPQPESYFGSVNTTGPRACYDEGKRCAEVLFFDAHRIHGTPVKVGRIFNTYGPHMHPRDGRIVSNFIVQALNDSPITIYGDGSQTRSLCYVDDLIELMLLFMRSGEDFIGPLNMGNPDERSVTEIAERILELTGSRSRVVYRPLPTDDPLRRCPDISLAREKFQWQPKTPLDDGLQATIDYFDRRLSRGSRRVAGGAATTRAAVQQAGGAGIE